MTNSKTTHCGYIAIIGQPNVGKSTLLNAILGRKLSITSRKPQTTRHRLLGVKTLDDAQMVFLDTPGLHLGYKRLLNRVMNKAVKSALSDVDLVLFVVEVNRWNEQDEAVLALLKKVKAPVLLVLNKIDQVKDRTALLPQIENLSSLYPFKHIVPVSAKQRESLDELEKLMRTYLPKGPFLFENDQVTDRSDRFVASEIVREKLMRFTGDEVPYSTSVTIDEFKKEEKLLRIRATIWVEKEGQKAILIGAEGGHMKTIGTQARLDLEKFFHQKVFLQLWVKVKKGWADDKSSLNHLGYDT